MDAALARVDRLARRRDCKQESRPISSSNPICRASRWTCPRLSESGHRRARCASSGVRRGAAGEDLVRVRRRGEGRARPAQRRQADGRSARHGAPGGRRAGELDRPGVWVRGALKKLDVDDWLAFSRGGEGEGVSDGRRRGEAGRWKCSAGASAISRSRCPAGRRDAAHVAGREIDGMAWWERAKGGSWRD